MNFENEVIVDARGIKCPLPVLKARKKIRCIPKGSRLRILCTDPLAEIDIPHMVSTDGHAIIDRGESDGVIWFLVEV